jgi:hypothetical protein
MSLPISLSNHLPPLAAYKIIRSSCEEELGPVSWALAALAWVGVTCLGLLVMLADCASACTCRFSS